MTVRTAAAAGARCSPVAIAPKRIVTTCAVSRSRKHELKLVLFNIVAAGVEPGCRKPVRSRNIARCPCPEDLVLMLAAALKAIVAGCRLCCARFRLAWSDEVQRTANWYAHASIARLQKSVPLSTTAHGSILVSHPCFSGAMPCPFYLS